MFAHKTPLFYSLLAALGDPSQGFKCRTLVLQGGTYAGKTYTTIQLLILFAAMEKVRICIAGSTLPHLRTGAQLDLEEILASTPELRYLFPDTKDYRNKSERLYKCRNGSTIRLDSFDVRKATGPKYDIVFFNEVIKIPYDVFDPLHTRANLLTICDYNSSYEFYIHKMIGKDGVKFFRCNHHHNDAIPETKHAEIEARSNEENWYRVYGEGKTGQTEGQIFKFTIVEGIPEDAQLVGYGMDFGFDPDPATLIAVYKWQGNLILHELVYARKLTIDPMCALLKESDLHPHKYIWADSAGKATIAELQGRGFNAKAVSKPQINERLTQAQRWPIMVTSSSYNLIHEMYAYVWETLPNGNKRASEKDNHCIDAWGYCVWMELRELPQPSAHMAKYKAIQEM